MNKAAAAHSANEASEVRQARRRFVIETQATSEAFDNERIFTRLGSERIRSVGNLLSDGSVIGLKTGGSTAVGAVLKRITYRRVFREHNFLKNISDVAKAAKVETFSAKFKKRTCELTHSIN